MAIYFKIRRPDGLYSNGGGSPGFTKTGKTWKNAGALTNHFLGVYGSDYKFKVNRMEKSDPYKDCELVVIEMHETVLSVVPVEKHLSKYRQGKEDKAMHEKAMQALKERRVKESQYEKLRIELGRES